VKPLPVGRRRPFRRIFVGSVIGGGLGVLLLLVLIGLVVLQGLNSAAHPTEGTSAATSVAGVLFSFVCFGLPTILICALLGAVAGFVRSMW